MFPCGPGFFRSGVAVAGDPYWSSVTSLLPCTGTAGSTTFTDAKGFSWTPAGDAKISSGQTLFGQNMAYFDGTGDYLTPGRAGTLNFYGQSFTWEAFLKTSATTNNCVVSFRSTSSRGWELFAQAGKVLDIAVWDTGGGYHDIFSSAVLPSNTLVHVSIGYDSVVGKYYLSVGGVVSAVSSSAVPTSYPSFGGALCSDISGVSSPYAYTGYVGQARTTLGVCRYTANFTPPTAAFPQF